MNMTEVARLLLGLRAAGWTEKEINDFMLYIESGEEQYKPTPKNGKAEQDLKDSLYLWILTDKYGGEQGGVAALLKF